MASPKQYGRPSVDIANVMQRLQGRCWSLTVPCCAFPLCLCCRIMLIRLLGTLPIPELCQIPIAVGKMQTHWHSLTARTTKLFLNTPYTWIPSILMRISTVLIHFLWLFQNKVAVGGLTVWLCIHCTMINRTFWWRDFLSTVHCILHGWREGQPCRGSLGLHYCESFVLEYPLRTKVYSKLLFSVPLALSQSYLEPKDWISQ